MRKLSLRMRLTFFTVLLLAGVSVLFTLSTIYNAQFSYVVPYLTSDISFDEFEVSEGTHSTIASSQAASTSVSSEAESYGPGPYTPDQISITSVMSSSTAQFNSISLWIMLAIIAGGGLLTYFLLGRALRPVRDLSTQIEGITEHELSQRVDAGDAHDEISSLAHSFNTVLSRLAKAFSDQKRFSSDAAHELKTPLAAIKTNLDVLQLSDDPTAEEYRQAVHVVKKQTERMIRLVDDLFTISSQRNYDFTDAVDFDSMFHDITAQLAPRIKEKKLAVNILPGGLATAGNSVMLMRAFSNLVENAVKYNVEGGSINISSFAEDKKYTFTIADTGVGIPEEKRELIFEPFYRADHSRSRKIGGAGLGLAIAKDIIERHGGSVSAAPGKNTGMVFTVILPRIPVE